MAIDWLLPSNWSTRRLGALAPEESVQVRPTDSPTTIFNYWGLEAIDKGQFQEPQPNLVLGSQIASTCVRFGPEHILYSKLRPYLNKVIVPSVEGIGTTEWIVLRPDLAMIDRRFLAYALRTYLFVIYASENSTGARMPRARKDALWEADIPLPYPDDPARSLETQRRIVARIEALFAELRECRKLHQAVVEDTNRLMDAVLAEVFDSAIVQSWPYEAQLSDLVEINAPLVDPTLPEYRHLPHINGEVIEQGSGQLLAYRTAAEDGMRSSKYLFKLGSVLYSKIRPRLRKVTTVDFVGLCSADMYPLELKAADLSKGFLKWALLSPHFTDYAVAESGRARMPKINRTELFAYRLRHPKLEEQERVAELLAAAQAELVEMKRTESEDGRLLEEMEQSILAQAFRGEL